MTDCYLDRESGSDFKLEIKLPDIYKQFVYPFSFTNERICVC